MSASKPKYKFDIAFSLLHKDLQYAQSIYDELGLYNLKTFLYQHNQKELANNNGISVFSEVFKASARVVVLFYRKGYGETYWTKIEHTAIQERYLAEGADFCVLIPMDETKPRWYPQFMQYIHAEMKPNDIAELILKKLVDRGGELKQKTYEEYLQEARSQRDRKIAHYEKLFADDTYPLVIGELNKIKALLLEKQAQMQQEINFLQTRWAGINIPTVYKNSLMIGPVGISINFSPEHYDVRGRASSQSHKVHISIYTIADINTGKKVVKEQVTYKINFYPDGKHGWSEAIVLPMETQDYYPKMLDAETGVYYEFSEIIHSSENLINEWFRKFAKIVFEVHKV